MQAKENPNLIKTRIVLKISSVLAYSESVPKEGIQLVTGDSVLPGPIKYSINGNSRGCNKTDYKGAPFLL